MWYLSDTMMPLNHKLKLSVMSEPPSVREPLKYGVTRSPYGMALWGLTTAGLCHLSLHDVCADPLTILRQRWPGYACRLCQAGADALSVQAADPDAPPIIAWAVGTALQIRVWQMLLQLKPGELVSYQQLAERVGCPGAVRAVGTAVGRNPIAWLIPCHRVIRKNGDSGQYHWGADRKKRMIQAETQQTVNAAG